MAACEDACALPNPKGVIIQGQIMSTCNKTTVCKMVNIGGQACAMDSVDEKWSINIQQDNNLCIYKNDCMGCPHAGGCTQSNQPASDCQYMYLSLDGEVIVGSGNFGGTPVWRNNVKGNGSKFWGAMLNNGTFAVREGVPPDFSGKLLWMLAWGSRTSRVDHRAGYAHQQAAGS
jgi:hypothetical protein